MTDVLGVIVVLKYAPMVHLAQKRLFPSGCYAGFQYKIWQDLQDKNDIFVKSQKNDFLEKF